MDQVLEPKLVNKLTELLGILSKKDALTIFLLSKEGLKAEADTPQKIGLTRKQYYTRLKQLVNNGLIDKYGDVYQHTTLGALLHQKYILELLGHVRNAKQMEMVDTLKRTKQFSEDDIANFVGKVAGTSLVSSTLPRIKVTWSYEDMISTVIDGIQLCKNEIFLASRFANDVIVNNISQKASAGLHIKVISDFDMVLSRLVSVKEKLEALNKNAIERLNVLGNVWYPMPENIGRKFMHIPYCAIVLDGKEAGIEIIDKNEPDKFKGAIFIKDEIFAAQIRKIFNSWWESAEDDDLMKLQNRVLDKSS